MQLVKSDNIDSEMPVKKQIEKLNRLINNPPSTSRVIEFTPALAEFILTELNHKNRPRKSSKIVQYSTDMANGKWLLTGETIAFGSDGLLKDGQNRLAACVRANTPFTSHAMFGIDPAAFAVMDTGANRSSSDILSIMGVPNANKVSTCIKLYNAWEKGFTTTRNISMTNEELRQRYMDFTDHDIVQRAVKAAELVWKVTGYPVSTLAAVYYKACMSGDEDKVIEFFSKMRDGIGTARSPQKVLMKAINQMRMDRYRSITSHDYAVMLCRAWYNYKSGSSSTKADVVVHTDDKLPSF